jgi:asparagine synthase (glutamine-hydrolysing)
MPGIVGFIGKRAQPDGSQIVQRMLGAMLHEPWYEKGSYGCEAMNSHVAWTSYSKSGPGCDPRVSEGGNAWLILAGDACADAQAVPGPEAGALDAQSLLELYLDAGADVARRLNGMFAGVVFDRRTREALIFNDRYGMHRIFLHRSNDGLYFASEAKALLSVLPSTRRFDPGGVSNLVTCGCTLGTRSLFKDIEVLAPATILSVVEGEIRSERVYFRPKEWESRAAAEEDATERIADVFDRVLRRHVSGPLPIGMSLTGGLDSRMIMAGLRPRPYTMPCYTFGSLYRDTFDVSVARQVAARSRQKHEVITLGETFLDDFPRHLQRAVTISDGTLGFSGAAELYLNALARGIAPVRLTGNYGGELLRGDRAFQAAAPRAGIVSAQFQQCVDAALAEFDALEAASSITFALFHQIPLQGYGRLAIERSQVVVRAPFMDNELVSAVYALPGRLLNGPALSLALISRYDPSLLDVPTDRGLTAAGAALLNLLRQLRREALFKAEYWSTHGMPSWLAATCGAPLRTALERTFSGRHKFQHFAQWSRGPLRGYIRAAVLDAARDMWELFDRPAVERMLNAHMSGRRNYLTELDRLATLSLGLEVLLKRQ